MPISYLFKGLLLDLRTVSLFSGHPTTGRRRSALRTRQKNCGLGNLGIEMLHTYILHAHTIHVHITILALRHFSLSFENSSLHAAFAMALPTGHGSLFFLSSSFTPPALFSFFSRDSLHVTFAVALPAANGIFFGSGCLRLLGVRACGLHLHGRLLCRGPRPLHREVEIPLPSPGLGGGLWRPACRHPHGSDGHHGRRVGAGPGTLHNCANTLEYFLVLTGSTLGYLVW